jgi:hypothetical protein
VFFEQNATDLFCRSRLGTDDTTLLLDVLDADDCTTGQQKNLTTDVQAV